MAVAVSALLLVVECNGHPVLARIGIIQALRADKPTAPESRLKAAKRYRVL